MSTFEEDFGDYEIEDLSNFTKKKKKINSSKKGKQAERDVVQILNERFKGILTEDVGGFSRSIGSGNRWGQKVHLSKEAKEFYCSDLVTPKTFIFTIESKKGYNDIDLNQAFSGNCKGLDAFLDQVTADAERSGKKPLLVWKKDRKPRIVFLRSNDFDSSKFNIKFVYKEWTAVSFDELLNFDNEFFFKKDE